MELTIQHGEYGMHQNHIDEIDSMLKRINEISTFITDNKTREIMLNVALGMLDLLAHVEQK